MNDLQLVLMIVGGVIIAAVLVFNWWQERRFHQQVEKGFSRIQNDALMDDPLTTAQLPPTESPAAPLPTSSLPTATDAHEAPIATDHDDFSINMDSVQTADSTDVEPTITFPDDADKETLSAGNTLDVPAAQAGSVDDVGSQDSNSYSLPEVQATHVKPANHAGIKAMIDDAFSKNLHAASPQNSTDIKPDAVEPLMEQNDDLPVATAPANTSTADLPAMLHGQVDLIAMLELNAATTVAEVVKTVKNDFDDYEKPVFVLVQTPDMHWQPLDAVSQSVFADQKITRMTCSLQLADRAGPVARNVINRFQLAVENLGLDISAHVEWLNSGDIAAEAVALDAFCIDVDKTMGFHLLHGENGAFTGTKLRGLAEAQGLELSADGTFKYYDELSRKQLPTGEGTPLPEFVMFNREQYPFSPDMLRTSVVKGVTFQLDIPHVSHCTEAFNHMVLVAKQMETGLNAQLVDDNNRPLGDAQLEKIRHQLKIIQATMQARGIVPGSDVAQRLFS